MKKLKVSWNSKITDQAFAVDEHAASQSLQHLAIEETYLTDVTVRIIIQQYSNLQVLKLPGAVGVESTLLRLFALIILTIIFIGLRNLYRLQNLRFVFWIRGNFDWATDPARTGIAAWGLMLNKTGETKSVVLQLLNARTDTASTVVVGYAGGAYLYLDNIRHSDQKTVRKFVTYNTV